MVCLPPGVAAPGATLLRPRQTAANHGGSLGQGALLGGALGLRLYGRVNADQFRRIVLGLLLASGLVLTLS